MCYIDTQTLARCIDGGNRQDNVGEAYVNHVCVERRSSELKHPPTTGTTNINNVLLFLYTL